MTNWGEKSLECALKLLGLLRPSHASWYHHFRAAVVILIGLFALVYKTTAEIDYFITHSSSSIQLVTIVDGLQYLVKALTTLIILMMFYRKSSTAARIMKELQPSTEAQTATSSDTDKYASENIIAGTVWVTFGLYSASMVGIRIWRFIPLLTSSSNEWLSI
jgi:hypothetical protein